jgi:hypothetical protein
MKRLILTSAAVACFGTAMAAQTPSGSQAPATSASQPSAAADKGTTVLTGCVYREKDVPGRAPNVAEKSGVLEDYILADVKPSASASAGSSTGTSGTGTSGTTGTSGAATGKSGAMYKLEKIADEQLRAAVGKRVEVTGRIDAESTDAKSATGASTTPTESAVGRDAVNLPEFEVSSMKQISGSCPATPSGD